MAYTSTKREKRRCSALLAFFLLLLMLPPAKLNAQARATPQELNSIESAVRQADFSEALALSEKACELRPQDERVWTLKALALSGLQRRTEALRAFQQALVLVPNYLPALKGASELAYGLHDASAERILQQLVHAQPADQVAQAMLGSLELRENDCQAADTHLAMAGSLIAEQRPLLERYSQCLVAQKDFARASTVFDQISVLEPNRDEPRYNSALALSRLHRYDDALRHLEPLLASDSPKEDTLTLAAQAYEQQDRTPDAVGLLRRAIALYPHDENAYLDFVNLSYHHESAQVGLDIATLGTQQNPQSPSLHFARGVLLCGLGRTPEGLAELETVNRLDPNLTDLSLANGIAQSQIQHSEQALARFRQATVTDPRDPLAWYLLAEALIQGSAAPGPDTVKEIETSGRHAMDLKPDQTEIYDLMAAFYLRIGQTADAATMCNRALAFDPSDVQALYHQVLVTRKMGDKAKVEEVVQKLVRARALENSNKDQIRVRKLTTSPAGTTESPSPEQR